MTTPNDPPRDPSGERPHERPVLLGAFANETEAQLIVQELRAAGIEAVSIGHTTAGFRAEAPGLAKVLVHEDDLARAAELVREFQSHPVEIDWDSVDLSGQGEKPDSP